MVVVVVVVRRPHVSGLSLTYVIKSPVHLLYLT